MEITITKTEDKEDIKHVNDQLFYYNLAHFPKDLRDRYEQINLVLKDEYGNVKGGILAAVCWNWLEIDTLIVDTELRKSGYGTQLLQEMEQIALERSCDFIKVDTLSFQALGFYEKHGYRVFGKIDGVGRDFTHYYLKKEL
ncbi:GNAT family N-acetyltransferase [Bacillus sp. H-16]|uniref:GNAT family N-acetyltransferase n=1 Tax=Alteribacter salitolerans TaxID=2912333 RepID=UPI001966806B|nr:GNAT family N-acetyltransferase [Alteribacter salitolerans]MBM7095244.1 GNAT family N-acetyltransferase [Alteribacter salitolerans]